MDIKFVSSFIFFISILLLGCNTAPSNNKSPAEKIDSIIANLLHAALQKEPIEEHQINPYFQFYSGEIIRTGEIHAAILYEVDEEFIDFRLYQLLKSEDLDTKAHQKWVLLDSIEHLEVDLSSCYMKFLDFNFDSTNDIYIQKYYSLGGPGASYAHLLTLKDKKLTLHPEIGDAPSLFPSDSLNIVRSSTPILCKKTLAYDLCISNYTWQNEKLVLRDEHCPCDPDL